MWYRNEVILFNWSVRREEREKFFLAVERRDIPYNKVPAIIGGDRVGYYIIGPGEEEIERRRDICCKRCELISHAKVLFAAILEWKTRHWRSGSLRRREEVEKNGITKTDDRRRLRKWWFEYSDVVTVTLIPGWRCTLARLFLSDQHGSPHVCSRQGRVPRNLSSFSERSVLAWCARLLPRGRCACRGRRELAAAGAALPWRHVWVDRYMRVAQCDTGDRSEWLFAVLAKLKGAQYRHFDIPVLEYGGSLWAVRSAGAQIRDQLGISSNIYTKQ